MRGAQPPAGDLIRFGALTNANAARIETAWTTARTASRTCTGGRRRAIAPEGDPAATAYEPGAAPAEGQALPARRSWPRWRQTPRESLSQLSQLNTVQTFAPPVVFRRLDERAG